MLPFEWKKSSARLILNRVAAIADVIRDHPQTDLKDAAVTNADTLDNPVAKKEAEVTGWDVVRQKFLASKAGLRPSTLKDWTLRVDRTMAVLDSKPKRWRTGTAVMERFKELFFIGPNGEETGPHAQMEAGSKGPPPQSEGCVELLDVLYGVDGAPCPTATAHRRRQSLRSWSAKPPSAQRNVRPRHSSQSNSRRFWMTS